MPLTRNTKTSSDRISSASLSLKSFQSCPQEFTAKTSQLNLTSLKLHLSENLPRCKQSNRMPSQNSTTIHKTKQSKVRKQTHHFLNSSCIQRYCALDIPEQKRSGKQSDLIKGLVTTNLQLKFSTPEGVSLDGCPGDT